MAEDGANHNHGIQLRTEVIVESIAPSNSETSVKNPEASEITVPEDDIDNEKSLAFADELMEKGNAAMKEADFSEASDLFSRALEIRVAHYGELAPECINTYYKFGLALLIKAQEEADPLGAMPKKDAESQQDSVKVDATKPKMERESSIASVSSNVDQCASSSQQGTEDVANKTEDDKHEESDTEEADEGEEDESDLDLAWKMLDLARAISEKAPEETLDMVDILSALAEVSLEREEIETSLSDYQKALSIVERLDEPDSRRIAELNFRICLCLEVGSKAQEAIPYCEKALTVCKSRLQRLMDEMKSLSGSTTTSAASEAVQGDDHPSAAPLSENPISDKQAEIETLTSLSSDLEKKLEDLQQLVSNPSSILADILGLVAAKAKAKDQAASAAAASSSRLGLATNNGEFDSLSTAHTNGSSSGVTHLGVVGRGVKRVIMKSGGDESSASKRPALDCKPDTDGSAGP